MENHTKTNGRPEISRRSFLGLGASFALTMAVAPSAFAIANKVTPAVKTSNGTIRGLIDDDVHTFLGVPYGAAPVGGLRFMPPQKPKPWGGILDTVRYGYSAMQLISGGVAVSYPGIVGPALSQIFSAPEDFLRQSENCLVLNVWTPAVGSAKKRPVMVWFHGGGFNYGSGSWPAYSGHNLARNHDVVVVTVNHRLNVFGYLNLAELGDGKYARSGNAGQLDLVASLEWVRDNIAEFGGDPGNVTIFGQSGGGSKVSTLLAMPVAKGLMHKAIIQSGPGLRGGTMQYTTQKAKAVLDKLNIRPDNLQALHDIPADKLLGAAQSLEAPGMGPGLGWGPVVDGNVLPANPFDPAASALCADIPVLIGFTKDETTLYNIGLPWWGKLTDEDLLNRVKAMAGPLAEPLIAAFRKLHPENSPSYLFNDMMSATFAFKDSVTLAERKAAQPAPVYTYIYNWSAPVENGILKAPHTIEIPFVFDNVELGPILLGTDLATKYLGRLTSSAWTAFARSGNPNTPGLPQWPKYDTGRRATMIFDVENKVVDDPMSEVRKILQVK